MELPTVPKKPLRIDPKFLILISPPKSGKTTLASLLENNLILDFEDGSDHVGGLTLKIDNMKELRKAVSLIRKSEHKYDYITLDSSTALEEICKDYATELYQATPMGKNFGKIDPKTGKKKPGQEDITHLPNGSGYQFLREAFLRISKVLESLPTKCLIMLGHTADKYVEKDGEEVEITSLALTGKLAMIICSKADAIGVLRRDKNTCVLDFDGGGRSVVEARADHLAGKRIVVSEKLENGEIVAYWDRIFKDLAND